MVTGAAGSIGSEICRQVARFHPACLIAFDQAESDLFRIENELRDKYPELELVTALGNIRETDRLSEVMLRNGVESIFHAAAYKHVPMMESHVLEAVRNNVLGTWNLVRAARAPERAQPADDLLRQGREPDLRDGRHQARLRAHRLGALPRQRADPLRLGALRQCAGQQRQRGSHVSGTDCRRRPHQGHAPGGAPLLHDHFRSRLAGGAGLHPSQGSEIFVLDMGEPIRIVDLAENMIRLAGKVPYEEIDIQFTGLRPGEKLIEEIRGQSEGLIATSSEKMHVIREQPLVWDRVMAGSTS